VNLPHNTIIRQNYIKAFTQNNIMGVCNLGHLLQVSAIIKLSATPSADHIVCSSDDTHCCLGEDSDKLILPIGGREK
jgi:hypothetical protein